MAEIVVGCDGSEGAKAALKFAASMAGELGDSLVLVFAYEPPGRLVGEEFKEHSKALEEYGNGILREADRMAGDLGVEAETLLVPKDPVVALDGLARERGARVIAVGTYGESPIRSAILGSTPHKLLHISETPVLCVRG